MPMAEILLAETVARELGKEGHSVVIAQDGERELAAFRATAPDLVILDWMLPKMDGLSVLRQLRAESNKPVLMDRVILLHRVAMVEETVQDDQCALKELVESMQGSVSVASQTDEGSEIIMTFKADQGDDRETTPQ